MPYTIEFAECVKAHFRILTASQRTLILDSIEKQLIHEPLTKIRTGEIMKILELSTTSKPLAEYADELDGDIIVVVSNNTPVAALVSLKDVDLESLSLSTNPDFYEILAHSRQEFTMGKTMSFGDMKREIANMD